MGRNGFSGSGEATGARPRRRDLVSLRVTGVDVDGCVVSLSARHQSFASPHRTALYTKYKIYDRRFCPICAFRSSTTVFLSRPSFFVSSIFFCLLCLASIRLVSSRLPRRGVQAVQPSGQAGDRGHPDAGVDADQPAADEVCRRAGWR